MKCSNGGLCRAGLGRDRVIAAPDAFFALPEVRMGLVPGAGGSVSVPRRIGRWRAAWLMLTGDPLPAPAALRWGLADEIGNFLAPVPKLTPAPSLQQKRVCC